MTIPFYLPPFINETIYISVSDLIVYGIAIALALGLLFGVFAFMYASYQVFVAILKRETKDKWDKTAHRTDETYMAMGALGRVWAGLYEDRCVDVHIVRDGVNLYGEYYDLGYRKAVIILPGRTEDHSYGYFFAKPYSDSGYNVLVIDPRAHGKSDGTYNTVGFEESKDTIEWAKYLHNYWNVESIVIHGICIGAAGGLFAHTDAQCPSYVTALIAEGMFINFNETMRNNLKMRKKPTFPVLAMFNFWMRHHTGHTMRFGPIDVIGGYRKPLLMLHGSADEQSPPALAQKLYDSCPSYNKQLVWFQGGHHSKLRITETEFYDKAIRDFLHGLDAA